MLFVLTPNFFKTSKNKKFYTILKDASGIIAKTHVKTNGVTVGKVYSVDLEANATKITIEVEDRVLIPVNSKVDVRTRGLLGDVFLEIIRADDTGQYISDGGMIPKSEDSMDLQGVIGLVGSIGKDVKKITSTLASVVGNKEGERSLKDILVNVEKLTADLRKTGETIRASVGDREKDVQSIVSNIQGTTADLKAFSKNLKDVLDDENKAKINRIIASFDDSMSDVKGATKNIRLISEKVEKGEGTLGKLVNDDSVIQEIKGAVKDVREILSPANKLQITVDAHVEGRNDQSSQSYFNILFRTRPDRYYLLGLTDGREATKETTTEQVSATDNQTKIRERTEETKATKFNLQLAKRWYDVVLRVGLFESAGGIGTDYYVWRDNIRFTVEAFDWKIRRNEVRRTAHVKAYVSILFFNHIYGMFGWDDITRDKDPRTREDSTTPNLFAGGGLTFNDQDLKALFGAAALAR